MEDQFHEILEELYYAFIGSPNSNFWPDFAPDNPMLGHGLWCFYRGLCVGTKIANMCNGW